MVLGLSYFTWFHVVLSLIGIGTGLVVLADMLAGKSRAGWVAVFLATTVLTSATGFGFPFERFLPSHAISIFSLLALGVAIYALYVRHLSGSWRRRYVAGSLVALYFNIFVLVVQTFLKVPALKALAPTQTEAPFLVAQLVVLIAFVLVGIRAARRF